MNNSSFTDTHAPDWPTSGNGTATAEIVSKKYWNHAEYVAYGVVMFVILTFGLLGNIFTIVVLKRKENRNKLIVPFIINLALADIFIIIFGYPVAISSNMIGEYGKLSQSRCSWSGFVNGSIGISSIGTYVVMSVLLCGSIATKKRAYVRRRLTPIQRNLLLLGIWLYGVLCMAPPLLGWNRFTPGAAGISCCPDWTSRAVLDISYNLTLVFIGFFVPMTVIGVCYFKMIRFFYFRGMPKHLRLKASWFRYQRRIIVMIAMSVAAFVLSWAPYCLVSIATIVQGHHVLQMGAAEIPELLAKASVVYNPLVYSIMDGRFRRRFKELFCCKKKKQAREKHV